MLFSEPRHVGRPNIGSEADFARLTSDIIRRRRLSNSGPLVEELEQKVSKYLGVRNCIAMVNGTVALEIAIRAVGLSGEVILPSYTFIATAHACRWQGLTPVFADIDPETHNLDPESVRAMISPKTTGIIGVHLWGNPAPVVELEIIASEHGLGLIYDAAHAFGNSFEGKMLGNFGQAEVFSFHATKFFNTFEGGAVVTNDDALAERVRRMRNFGFVDFDEVVTEGTNGKMTEVCAAMGLVNLKSVGSFIEHNRDNYYSYKQVFSKSTLVSLFDLERATTSNYQYVVVELAQEVAIFRDRLVSDLHGANVLARRYFWPGCHKMMPYRSMFPDADLHLEYTNQIAERVVILPTGTAVTPTECQVIGEFLLRCLEGYIE